jgi:hypothetical protein
VVALSGSAASSTGTTAAPAAPTSTGDQLLKDAGKTLEDTGNALKSLLP